MIIECLVIIGIIFAITVIFLRTRKEHAVMTVPLMIIPFANLMAQLLAAPIASLLPLDTFIVSVLLNIIAVVISSLMIGVLSFRFKKRSNKIAYAFPTILFNVLLAMILIQHYYVNRI